MNRRLRCLLLAHAVAAFRPPARRLHQGLALRAAADADVNSLMTQLNAAVQQEDFRKAAELKKRLEAINGGATTKSGDWASRGAPGWLQARLQDLGMRFPTPVQEAALDAVDGSTDVVVSAPTGSGKTYTLSGPPSDGPAGDDPELRGLAPRVLEELFRKMARRPRGAFYYLLPLPAGLAEEVDRGDAGVSAAATGTTICCCRRCIIRTRHRLFLLGTHTRHLEESLLRLRRFGINFVQWGSDLTTYEYDGRHRKHKRYV